VSAIDPKQLRSILGSYATGVTVVTTVDACEAPVGVTANSFTSVSLEPPLVSWCLRRDSYSLFAFRRSRRYTINVLGSSHKELCAQFAKGGPQKWRGIAYRLGENGCPILEQAIATVECKTVGEYDAGDHIILIGEVGRASAENVAQPLVFFRGRYYQLNLDTGDAVVAE
jgi:flavin reductase (DIM6/NTAB) family NADH-FMN oxidoreductase RutF